MIRHGVQTQVDCLQRGRFNHYTTSRLEIIKKGKLKLVVIIIEIPVVIVCAMF